MRTSSPVPERGAVRPLWLRRGYLVVLGALAVLAAVAHWLAAGSGVATLAVVLTFLWTVPLAAWALRLAWRKLTYRVGVRLFISYLLIGLTPFAVCACLALIAGYVLVGQYAAARVGNEMQRLSAAMAARAATAAREVGQGRTEYARELLQTGSSDIEREMHEEWMLTDTSGEWRSHGAAALPVPTWVQEGGWRGQVVSGASVYAVAIERRGECVATVLLPLDLATARAFAPGRWYEVRFVTDLKVGQPEGTQGRDGAITVASNPGAASLLRVNGRPVPVTQVERGWLAAGRAEGNRWQRTRLLWLWAGSTPRALETGKEVKGSPFLTLIKLSPRGAIEDLFGPSDRLKGEVKGLVVTLAGFGTLYLIAVGFAAVMILRVTSSTARLTRGARAVARGDLDYRVRVKRHDQLGELAVSFNSMAGSVRTMLAQVAERERMAKEVELAREIQSSLLPPSELSSGPISVWAHFRPAAEVGGDYFDLFPLAPGDLLVAIGDVAGHGLPTGLLMAMVKSAVATLVEEGYRGVEMLSKLNHLLLAQSLKQRMVSFALAETDAERREVRITSAGHQPGVLLAADGPAEEVLLSSLPLGHRWPDPPPTRTLPFGPGGRLLLYSDGLVEARDAAGAPFGHQRLREALEAHRGDDGPALVRALLSELDRYLAGQPLADDLTVVLVEHLATVS